MVAEFEYELSVSLSPPHSHTSLYVRGLLTCPWAACRSPLPRDMQGLGCCLPLCLSLGMRIAVRPWV